MIDPHSSELFTVRRTSESDVETAVLDRSVSRRSVWFDRVVPDVVADGRYVPLYVDGADGGPELIVLDLRDDDYRRIASAHPGGPTPVVDRERGEVIVSTGTSACAVALDGSGRRTLGTVDEDGRSPGVDRDRPSMSAGLTRSADGDSIGLGIADNGNFRVGALDAATGEVATWHERSRPLVSVRFSPTDPSLLLFALETDADAAGRVADEAWLAREGLGARPLAGLLPERHRSHWWDPDGTGLWYVAPGSGVEYLDLELARREVVWSTAATRAHATGDGRLVATTGGDEPTVGVYDRTADESLVVARVAESTTRQRAQPQFVGDDEYLAYATSVDGEPTVALAPVDALRERL